MAVHIWKYLLIDRINISISIGSKELYSFALEQLYGIKELQTNLVPHGKFKIAKYKYLTRLDYYPTEKNKIADIEVGTTKSKHRYFRLGLYPSKFGAGEFEHFKEVLALLLPEFDYQKLYKTGRVSYIELAADSLSHIIHSFIPFRSRCSCSFIFVDKNGKAGTTYIGSKTSNLRFCIYDKHKQLTESNAPATYDKHTRIEARSRHIGLMPCELLEKMSNPFEKLEIADLQKARDASKDKIWQAFLDQCLKVGSAQALSQNPKKRKQFMKMLRASAAPWWNPQHIWEGLPKALKAIKP